MAIFNGSMSLYCKWTEYIILQQVVTSELKFRSVKMHRPINYKLTRQVAVLTNMYSPDSVRQSAVESKRQKIQSVGRG